MLGGEDFIDAGFRALLVWGGDEVGSGPAFVDAGFVGEDGGSGVVVDDAGGDGGAEGEGVEEGFFRFCGSGGEGAGGRRSQDGAGERRATEGGTEHCVGRRRRRRLEVKFGGENEMQW